MRDPVFTVQRTAKERQPIYTHCMATKSRRGPAPIERWPSTNDTWRSPTSRYQISTTTTHGRSLAHRILMGCIHLMQTSMAEVPVAAAAQKRKSRGGERWRGGWKVSDEALMYSMIPKVFASQQAREPRQSIFSLARSAQTHG